MNTLDLPKDKNSKIDFNIILEMITGLPRINGDPIGILRPVYNKWHVDGTVAGLCGATDFIQTCQEQRNQE